MKIIQTQAAQGDVMFRKIAELPEGLSSAKAEHGAFVVAHSETGHNHIVMERPTVKMFAAMDEFRSYLVIEDKPAKVEHLRNFDTHETIALSPGIWEVRRQREYTPEGFRRAAD
jgi:hypothetical protein